MYHIEHIVLVSSTTWKGKSVLNVILRHFSLQKIHEVYVYLLDFLSLIIWIFVFLLDLNYKLILLVKLIHIRLCRSTKISSFSFSLFVNFLYLYINHTSSTYIWLNKYSYIMRLLFCFFFFLFVLTFQIIY